MVEGLRKCLMREVPLSWLAEVVGPGRAPPSRTHRVDQAVGSAKKPRAERKVWPAAFQGPGAGAVAVVRRPRLVAVTAAMQFFP